MSDGRRFWELTWMLAVTDWRLRFYGSALGYAWTLARPFAFFGVIYIVFTEVAKIGNDIKDYGICILFSMVLFQFFGEATGGSVNAIVRRESLLRKMRFPHLAIPLSTVLTALMNLVATLAAVFVFAIASGVYPNWGWLELPLLIALLTVVADSLCRVDDPRGLAAPVSVQPDRGGAHAGPPRRRRSRRADRVGAARWRRLAARPVRVHGARARARHLGLQARGALPRREPLARRLEQAVQQRLQLAAEE
jgi:hypothetical protein